MARYKVILAYDGTAYDGFQRQAKRPPRQTIQGTFEIALRNIGWQGRSILAAGRTDAGVHASGQVIAFDMDWKHATEALHAALNANLPTDVVVLAVLPTRADFHPRYDAIARRYHYQLFCSELRDPFRERFAWRVWPPVNLSLLKQAAGFLVGEYDFAAFGTSPRPEGTTIRRVIQACWHEEGDHLIFEIIADSFLYRMVRRLVATQIAIGQGKMEVAAIKDLLKDGKRSRVRMLAPPHGLILCEVIYPSSDVEISEDGEKI